MKKFLVGVIFLIPIVVVIALSATGAIISLTTPVNPSELVIKDSDNVELDKNAIVKVDSRNYDEFIIIEVLPSITQDKAITYERVEEAGEGEVILEQIGDTNRYSITPVKIGVTKLEIRAKANINVYKEVTFYVTSDSIETINIYDEKGLDVGEHRNVYHGEKYYVDLNPVEALRNNDIQWSSSNTSVAEISANGELKVVGKGLTRIKVNAVDKDGNTISDYVDIDTSGAMVSSKTIYTSESELSIDWIKQNHTLDSEVEVSSVQENIYLFQKGEQAVEVEFVNASSDGWGFLELANVMYTRNGGYYPIVGRLVSGEVLEDATIEVSNSEILELEPVTGMLVPVKAGSVMVKATYDGVSVEKEVVVRENPIAFELELGSADQKLGIQLARTWGQYFLDENGNLTDTFIFGLADKSNAFDVEWSLSNFEYATFTKVENGQDIALKFLDGVRGNSVTLTATLKVNNLLQERVKRSFTFNIKEKNAVNVYSWDEFDRVVNIKRHDIVLQADVYPDHTVGLGCSLYGNGFKVDATNFPIVENTWRTYVIDTTWDGNGHYEWKETGSGKTIVEDVNFIGSPAYKDTDHVLEAFAFNWSFCPVEVKYCQISGFSDGIYVHNVQNILIEGCIIGDNFNTGVSLGYEPGRAQRCTVTLRNNIFKQTGTAAVQLATSWFHENAMDKVFSMDINIEGFMDVYNWKQRSEFKDIFSSSLLGMVGTDIVSGSLRDMLVDAVAKIVNSFINEPEYDHIFYKYGGKEYASFAFVGMGLTAIADPNIINTENANDNLQKYVVPLEDASGTPVGQLASISSLVNMVVKPTKPMHITNSCFLVCADFENGEPEIKPGDPVPNSKELYAKLTSAINS
ncbi:MAG: right-handed parallel beta-helix repeat-containing protein [Clostridia bacterium]|nr:right-handed parallel beta-helix repeat-containing protein [Clostridia bacterium]